MSIANKYITREGTVNLTSKENNAYHLIQ